MNIEDRIRELEKMQAQDFLAPKPDPLVQTPSMAQPGPAPEGEVTQLPSQGSPTKITVTKGQGAEQGSLSGDTQAQPDLTQDIDTRINEVTELLRSTTPATIPTGNKDIDAAQNAINAFNRKVANTLGAPAEVVNELLSLVGMGIVKPGQHQQATRDAFQNFGIDMNVVDGLSKEMGEALFTTMAGYAGLLAAAPTMAAKSGASVTDHIIRTVGQFVQKHPWLTGIEEVGATVGGVLGEGTTKGTGAFGEAAGTLAGAVAGSVVAGGAARRMQGAGNWVANKFRTQPTHSTAIRDPNVDTSEVTTFTKDQIEGDMKVLQDAIDNAILSVPRTGTARQAQEILRGNLDYAEQLGRQIESRFWERVPLKQPIPTAQMRKDLEAMEARLYEENRFGENVPTKEIEKLKDIGTPKRDPETGRMYKDLPTVEQLRNKSREYKIASRKEAATDAPDNMRIGYLNELAAILDKAIADGLPNDVSIKQAREFSILFNDIFTRGPIGNVTRTSRSGADRIPEGMTAEALMKEYDGVVSATSMAKQLRQIKVAGRNVLDPIDRQFLDGVESQMEQAIRNMFHEAATGPNGSPNPELAAKWLQKYGPAIKPLAGAAAELKRTVDVAMALRQEQDDIAKSFLAKFSQRSPEKAISSIWNAPDPVKAAREVRGALSNIPQGLKALEAGMIDALWTRTGGDINAIQNLLKDGSLRRMMEVTVDAGAMQRLDRILAVADKFKSGDAKTLRQVLQPGGSLLGRILGAHLGRALAPGQLQAPSIMSQNGMRLAEFIFGSTPPDVLLRNAVADPKWERILLNRLPSNTKEFKRMARTIGGLVGTQQSISGFLEDDTR